MRLRSSFLLLALSIASIAQAEDWLAGDYEIIAPDRPAPRHFLMTITQDTDGHYRHETFEESVDASTGRIVRRLVPPFSSPDAGVRELMPEEMAPSDGVDLVAARVRCALVDWMMLCLIPEGPGLVLEDRTLAPGYFAGAMHVGFMEVHRKPPAAPGDLRGSP